MDYWWVPIAVATITIVPGLLAWSAARGVRAEVSTNHGKRLGEYVELLAAKTEIIDTKQDVQHAALASQIQKLADDLRQHMDAEEATHEATRRAVARAMARVRADEGGNRTNDLRRLTRASRGQ
jgi:hypothetical protein